MSYKRQTEGAGKRICEEWSRDHHASTQQVPVSALHAIGMQWQSRGTCDAAAKSERVESRPEFYLKSSGAAAFDIFLKQGNHTVRSAVFQVPGCRASILRTGREPEEAGGGAGKQPGNETMPTGRKGLAMETEKSGRIQEMPRG